MRNEKDEKREMRKAMAREFLNRDGEARMP